LVVRDRYPKPHLHLMDCELDRVFAKYLAGRSVRSILEVGCGSSRWLPYFARQLGLCVHGIDYSPKGITNARANLESNGVDGELIEADFFSQADTGRPRVDAVFSLGLLEHFSDPVVALATMTRFLNPGGTVVSLMPNIPGRILNWSCRLNPGLESFYCSLDVEGWRRVHERCGLEVLDAFYAQFFDWTWLNISHLTPRAQVWASRVFRLVSLPCVWAGRGLGLFIRSRRWCSGIIVVARMPAGPPGP
jgi:SAM-dependent methyltransferase